MNEAAALGNAQSDFQLFLIHSTIPEKEDTVLAYNHLMKAVTRGITFFDQLNSFFKDNYDKLAPVFLKTKKYDEVKVENKEEVMNLHNALVKEI